MQGFRFQAKGVLRDYLTYFVQVRGLCPGVRLEELTLEAPGLVSGIYVVNAAIPAAELPIVVRKCTIDVKGVGVIVSGSSGIQTTGIRIMENHISNSCKGVSLEMNLARLHVMGNVVRNCSMADVELRGLMPEAREILIANNTFFGSAANLRVWDEPPHHPLRKGQVTVRNNILLGSLFFDLVYVRTTKDAADVIPSESQFLLDLWTFDHNWRDLAGAKVYKVMPLAPEDRQLEGQEFVSQAAGNPGFLRPKTDSPLAREGAGRSDPFLPAYVGAVPPEGVEPWNWQWTWDGQVHRLLTVSKEARTGGRFRTLGDALKQVKPDMTVRVLDAETYSEPLRLDQPEQHRGLTLEAPNRATLFLSGGEWRHALHIQGVPKVRVKGFRFREARSTPQSNFVLVTMAAPGVVLEDLEMEATGDVFAIALRNVSSAPGADPVLIRRCTIGLRGENSAGISVFGSGVDAQQHSSGVRIEENRIQGGQKGIALEGLVARVQVSGNLVWNAKYAGLELADLVAGFDQVLIANNTVFNCAFDFRIWDNNPDEAKYQQGQVELRNNLFMEAITGDMGFLTWPRGGSKAVGGDGKWLRRWRFDHNWRDLSGNGTMFLLPLAPEDRKLEQGDLRSRVASHPDFMRPASGSPLATQGAGSADPALPPYVGAVPPDDAVKWDWDTTWKTHRDQESKP
jgi:nitrous oxidase accessory protein NosD